MEPGEEIPHMSWPASRKSPGGELPCSAPARTASTATVPPRVPLPTGKLFHAQRRSAWIHARPSARATPTLFSRNSTTRLSPGPPAITCAIFACSSPIHESLRLRRRRQSAFNGLQPLVHLLHQLLQVAQTLVLAAFG